MSIELIVTLLFLAFIASLALGLPIAFCLMGVATVFTAIFFGPQALYMAFTSVYGVMTLEIYICGPLFIFMATVLQFSGIVAGLYDMMYKWSGSLRGGLAAGTILACTIIAAMTGVSATGTVTMGLLAYPEMAKRGYDRKLSVGVITVGGTLGPLIPPSILMVIVGGLAKLSIGKLFAGGVLPGLLMSFLFVAYILIRCKLNSNLAPSLPKEERPAWKEKFASVRALALPVLLIVAVLGGIYSGAATPTEAAGVGAVGAIGCAAVNRTLSWNNLKQAMRETLRVSTMILWLLIGGMSFSYFLSASGGGDYLVRLMAGIPLGAYGTVGLMLVIVIILGCFIDGAAITVICVPIFYPIIYALNIDPLWFGLLFVIGLVIGLVTPPFGFNLFFAKGVLPKDVTMQDIYAAVVPFILLQLVTLALCVVFPTIILLLPSLMK